MYITIASLSVNNNDTTFAINSGEEISAISPNSILYVAGATLPTQVSWENGAPKLSEPWSENSFSNAKARIFVGIQGLVDAVNSAKSVSNNLNNKTDEVNGIISNQGSAAALDAQTNQLDFNANKLLKVGAFGLSHPVEVTSGSAFDDLPSGFYQLTGSVTDKPSSAGQAVVVNRGAEGKGNEGFILYSDQGSGELYLSKKIGGNNGDWIKLYHSKNLNTNEFGGVGIGDFIADGYAFNATTAIFILPINSYSPPSSISISGEFNIFKEGIGSIATSIIPIISGASSNRVLYLQVDGLSGLTNRERLTLTSTTAESKITVNF